MLRKTCTTENLAQYYSDFLINNIINHEVHPWIAESWRSSKEKNIPNKNLLLQDNFISPNTIKEHPLHEIIIEYLKNFYNSIPDFFAEYSLKMILTDNKEYILKIYSKDLFTDSDADRFFGVCCSEEYLGTSSLSITNKYGVPFMTFGPEMWQTELQSHDFISLPIFLDKKLLYTLTFSFPTGQENFSNIYFSLLSIKHSLEEYLKLAVRIEALDEIFDAIDATTYYIDPNSTVEHTNRKADFLLTDKNKLSDLYVNYRYIPIVDGFNGKRIINKEQSWVTHSKSANELTTILPVRLPNIDEIFRVISFSMPIEKLKELNARTFNYDARKSLLRIPIKNLSLSKTREKAIALGKKKNTVLLESEAGSALSRFAYGMHQLSPYSSGHFVTFNYVTDKIPSCQNIHDRLSENLSMANNGTLFIQDIEKYDVAEGDIIADTLKEYTAQNKAGKIRIIASANSNIKVLTTKGLFSQKLYNIVKKHVLKISPLRDRPEDIELLAEFIINELSEKVELPSKKRLSQEAMKVIKEYCWPGNVMELASVLEIAFFQAEGNIICADNIKLPNKNIDYKNWKQDKQSFIEAWKLSGGKITNMANMLSVSRITLYRYLHKFNLLGGGGGQTPKKSKKNNY